MNAARRSWVEANLHKGMLPVNTLRDLIRTNQFFASSALVLASGVAGFALQATHLSQALYAKLLCMMVLQGGNFVFFMHATRFLCHCEILINAPDINGVPVTANLVSHVLLRSTELWSAGLKGLMITAPLLLWMFGPLYLVLGVLALISAWRILEWDAFDEHLRQPQSDDAIAITHGMAHADVDEAQVELRGAG